MIQDDKENAKQSEGNDPVSNDKGTESQPSTASEKIGEIEEKLSKAAKKARAISRETMEMAQQHSHYTELGASLAGSVAAEGLGEILGAGIGSVLGPEGTVVGVELGSMAGEVFGARKGEITAKKLLHDNESETPLNEDLQKEGSAKITEQAGKQIGCLIGDVLFDDAGGEVGEVVGEKIGKLAGSLAYERIEKLRGPKKEEPVSGNGSKSNTDSATDSTPE